MSSDEIIALTRGELGAGHISERRSSSVPHPAD